MDLSILTFWMNGSFAKYPKLPRPISFRKKDSKRTMKVKYHYKTGIVCDVIDIDDIFNNIGVEEFKKSLFEYKRRPYLKGYDQLVKQIYYLIYRARMYAIMEQLLDNREAFMLNDNIALSLYSDEVNSKRLGKYSRIKIAVDTSLEMREILKYNVFAVPHKRIRKKLYYISKKGIFFKKPKERIYE